MRTIARIFVRDLKRILRNPVAIVITIGVCIIPSLYAWTNIIANDDPYRNTSTIPIAVVIADEGADIPGMGTVNAGSMLRDELAHNDQLGWTFVDSDEEARDGVSAGTYFAAFIIPTDFTAGIADVLTGDTEPAHITYLVNEKANAVAPKVTDTGASTLEEEIAGRFTALVGETVTERLSGAADTGATALDDARAGAASELSESARLLRDLGDGLARAGESVGGARTAVGATRATMAELSGTATSLADALAGARQHLAETRAGAQQLTADIAGAVGAASGTVAGISSTAAYDIGALAGDVGWAQGKIDAALAALTGVAGDLQGMRDSLARARDEIAAASVEGAAAAARQDLLDRMDGTVAALDGAIGDLTANIAALQQVSDHIKAGAESMRGLSATVNGAIQQATASLAGLQADLLTTTLPALSSGLDAFADAGGALTGAAGSVGALIAQTDGTLATLDGLLAQGADAVGRTAGAVTTAADDVDSLARDLSLIESARETPVVRDLIALDPATVGAFMGSPVSLVDEAVFPVRNYGSGVAPFYTNLALWVGGFVLVAIYKLEVDEEGIGAVSPWQATLGRGALIAALGQVQALILLHGRHRPRHAVRLARRVHRSGPCRLVCLRVDRLRPRRRLQARRQGARCAPRRAADPRRVGPLPHPDAAAVFPRARAVAPLHLRHRRHARGGGGLLRRLLRQKPPHERCVNRARHASPARAHKRPLRPQPRRDGPHGGRAHHPRRYRRRPRAAPPGAHRHARAARRRP